MKFRNFRKRATGQWVDVLFTVNADSFNIPEESHRAAIAEALGLAMTDLETVERNVDSRIGILIAQPQFPRIITAKELAGIAAVNALVAAIDNIFSTRLLGLTDIEKTAIQNRLLNLINK